MSSQDFPEHHAIVTYERFACGLLTADGFDEEPCPYSSSSPQLDEFDFIANEDGQFWVCRHLPKTQRAKRDDLNHGLVLELRVDPSQPVGPQFVPVGQQNFEQTPLALSTLNHARTRESP
jgi:hypothetical protein